MVHCTSKQWWSKAVGYASLLCELQEGHFQFCTLCVQWAAVGQHGSALSHIFSAWKSCLIPHRAIQPLDIKSTEPLNYIESVVLSKSVCASTDVCVCALIAHVTRWCCGFTAFAPVLINISASHGNMSLQAAERGFAQAASQGGSAPVCNNTTPFIAAIYMREQKASGSRRAQRSAPHESLGPGFDLRRGQALCLAQNHWETLMIVQEQ